MNTAIRPVASIHDATLWTVALDASEALSWRAFLSNEERARAARFAFAKDRTRYEAAHGALRLLLAQAVGATPESLRFTTGLHGKPGLADQPAVAFNLSHSKDVALVGIGRTSLGVDVEVLRPVQAWADLAAAHFTASEQAAIAHLLPEHRASAFLRCWTRKEACLKAMGSGLTIDTRSIDTAMARPGAMPVQVTTGQGTVRVQSLDIGTTAIAAVAFMESSAAALPRLRSVEACSA